MLSQKIFSLENDKITAKILDFPHVVQPNGYSCGTAATLAILVYYGIVDQKEPFLEQILHTNSNDGTRVLDIIAYLNTQGLSVDARKMQIADLESYIDQEIPILVMIQAWPENEPIDYPTAWDDGHYVVVIGYSDEHLFFMDPVLYTIGYITKQEFLERRHDQDNQDEIYVNYGVAVYGKPVVYTKDIIQKIQ